MHGSGRRLVLVAWLGLTLLVFGTAAVAQPALPLPDGRYVGAAAVGTDLEVLIAIRIGGKTLMASLVGPNLSGIFSQQTNIDSKGAFGFVVYGKNGADSITYGIYGKRIGSGLSGEWLCSNGHKGRWGADKLGDVANAGSWSLISPTGARGAYSWTAAFAVLGRAKGHDYLALFFDGPSTRYPVDACLTVADPGAIAVGGSVPINDLLLRPAADPTAHYYAKEGAANRVTFSQIGRAPGSLLSGALTCTEKQFGGSLQLQLTNQPFANIKLVRDYRTR